jgi:hypothetical protein
MHADQDLPLADAAPSDQPVGEPEALIESGPQRLATPPDGGSTRLGRALHKVTSFVLPGAAHSMPANVMRTNLAMAGTFAALQAGTDQAVFDQVYQGFTTNGLLYAGSALAIGLATNQIKMPIGHIPERLQEFGHGITAGFKRLRQGFDEWCERPHALNRTVATIHDGISSFLPTQLSDPLQSVGASAMGVGAYFLMQGQATQNPIEIGLGAFNIALGAWNTFQSKQVARGADDDTPPTSPNTGPTPTPLSDPSMATMGI